jgi:hypothetical protein
MTWKTGDTAPLPVYMETAAGAPVVYASYAAFVAAGWSAVFYSGAVALASQPAITIAPIGATGWHALTFILPAGVDHLLITPPSAAFRSDPANYPLVVPAADTDALLAAIVAAVGGPANPVGVTVFDFTSVEGDNFVPQEFTIPLSSLRLLDVASKAIVQYADLSDIGGQPWTVTAQARGAWNRLPASAVSFAYSPVISDKVNRKVALGFPVTAPAGAVVVNPDGTPDTTGSQTSTAYQFDIQLQPPSGSTFAGERLSPVIGTHTIIRQQTTSP